ncbi:unannotated protein [freshwater metagenome]|uniref:Unannotated protein n=1 Tax=freshwater metagenome TaxID=449393 RepID=A0A6J7I244_9ZZZZ|nr:hypothetical protein [Actinomycetota bacterium]
MAATSTGAHLVKTKLEERPPRGRYRVRVYATDAAGNQAKPIYRTLSLR